MSGRMTYKSLALLQKRRTFTDFYGLRTPTFMAYKPRLLRHMSRFYWGRGRLKYSEVHAATHGRRPMLSSLELTHRL